MQGPAKCAIRDMNMQWNILRPRSRTWLKDQSRWIYEIVVCSAMNGGEMSFGGWESGYIHVVYPWGIGQGSKMHSTMHKVLFLFMILPNFSSKYTITDEGNNPFESFLEIHCRRACEKFPLLTVQYLIFTCLATSSFWASYLVPSSPYHRS